MGKIPEILNKARDHALLLAAIGIPFSIGLGNLMLLLALALSFYRPRTSGSRMGVSETIILWFPLVFFGWVLISALQSADLGQGLKQVEKHLLLVLIPLLFYLNRGAVRTGFAQLMKAFSISAFASATLLIAYAIYRFLSSGEAEYLFFHEFGMLFDLHPVYFALLLSIACLWWIRAQLPASPGHRRITGLLALLPGLVGIALCASKIVLVIVPPLLLLEGLRVLRGKFRLALVLSLGATLLLLLWNTPYLQDRFSEGLTFRMTALETTSNYGLAQEFTNAEKAEISDLELRYLMWKIGLSHAWMDGAWVWGYGIGDVQYFTDLYYTYYGLAPGWFEGYNLHNQYVQYWVTYGIFATVFFSIYLVVSFYRAIRARDLFHLYFLLWMLMVFMTESLLSRNKGLVMFYFLNTLFLLNRLNDEDRNPGYPGHS